MDCRDISELAPLYFSGELAGARRMDFDTHLADCQSCARQIEQQGRIDAHLREAVLGEAADTGIAEERIRELIASGTAAPSAERRRRWLAVAAGFLLLVTAAAGYRAFLGNHVPQVYADAADDHQDEVVAQQRRVWQYERAAIAELARRYQIPVEDIGALEAEGYRLERGKICELDHQLYLHLVYASPGQEFSLFLRPADNRQLSGSTAARVQGKRIFTADRGSAHVAGFQTSSVTAFVVTDEASDTALHIAELAAKTF
jgi:anti-sigma factor RsiW